MDFSTLRRREAACVREVKLNRRTAPDLYLGVAPIIRTSEGPLQIGDPSSAGGRTTEGAAVEWAVVMRRFPQSALFDRIADGGGLTLELAGALADEVRHFHDRASRVTGRQDPHFGSARLAAVIDENAQELAERPDLFPPVRTEAYARTVLRAWKDIAPLLDERLAQGWVRRCHGDLHLRNICLLDGRPALFDAIEFNDAIADIDVLYDLAFLLMDLDQRGLRAQANLIFNRNLRGPDDLRALAALPCFLSCRAAIRAKVAASAEPSQAGEEARAAKREEARRYFKAAVAYLNPQSARLVAVGGRSGSGKSSLAYRLAPELGQSPGAVVLRSDILRKALFGVAVTTRLEQAAYDRKVTKRVFRALREQAATALAAGQAVIVDAVYAKPSQRAEIEAIAGNLGLPFTGFWLEAPADVLLQRVAVRRGDASDATPRVVRRQLGLDPGPIDWHRIDASGSREAVAEAARQRLL
jgi:aminoglycoside phosphotransferase family enzyme